jgi:hypothetical protein
MQVRSRTDLVLDVVDGIRGFYLKSNGFTRKGLDENLHSCLNTRVNTSDEEKRWTENTTNQVTTAQQQLRL